MKKEIHPQDYRQVLFIDSSSGAEFIIPSTIKTTEVGKPARTERGSARSGGQYPTVRIEISSASHPFYTGQEKTLDTAGRVERFKQKQAKASKKKPIRSTQGK
ncbi:MAG: type B 50S ribosomal protein L31 [bacterium]|nr:type B 50S ribosomal protein L31 [bacterium]